MPNDPIEVTVARLDERMGAFRDVMEQMAADQRSMAESYEKLVESNQRIALIEQEVVNVNKSVSKLWEKYNELFSSYNASEKSRIEEERKASKTWLNELIKMVMAAAIGAIVTWRFK